MAGGSEGAIRRNTRRTDASDARLVKLPCLGVCMVPELLGSKLDILEIDVLSVTSEQFCRRTQSIVSRQRLKQVGNQLGPAKIKRAYRQGVLWLKRFFALLLCSASPPQTKLGSDPHHAVVTQKHWVTVYH